MNLRIEFTGTSDHALLLQDTVVADCPQGTVRFHENNSHSRVGGSEVALIILVALVAPAELARLLDALYRIRQRFRPMMVLDLSQDEPVLTVIEDAPGGRGTMVIKTPAGEEHTVVDGPELPASQIQALIKTYLPPGK